MKKVNQPFFVKLLENEISRKEEKECQGGRIDVTLKYPSDNDEIVTMKAPSDNDEDIIAI